jgi:hypothetical protein
MYAEELCTLYPVFPEFNLGQQTCLNVGLNINGAYQSKVNGCKDFIKCHNWDKSRIPNGGMRWGLEQRRAGGVDVPKSLVEHNTYISSF